MENDEAIKQQLVIEIDKLPKDKSILFADLQKQAPTLASEIIRAKDHANNASGLDVVVDVPHQIEILDKKARGDIAIMRQNPFSFTNDAASLRIEGNEIKNHTLQDFRATVEHEFMHKIQKETDGWGFLKSKFNEENARSLEYAADRGADAVEAIGAVLRTTLKHPEGHGFDATYSNHPNNRDRVGALLSEAYGNDVFKFSGNISGKDGYFSPKSDKDGISLTEDNKQVTNWKEIETAIKVQVESDLKRLDKFVQDGLTEQEINEFKTSVSNSVVKFREQHPFNFHSNTSEAINLNSLADGFLKNTDQNKSVVDAHVAEEPRMLQAYSALALGKQSINRDLTLNQFDKNTRITTLAETISEGIRKDNFPSIEKLSYEKQQQLA